MCFVAKRESFRKCNSSRMALLPIIVLMFDIVPHYHTNSIKHLPTHFTPQRGLS